MKKIFFLATALTLSGVMMAQPINPYLVAADKYYNEGDFYSASQYYEKYLNGENPKAKTNIYNPYAVSATPSKKTLNAPVSSREQVIYNLAESYRKLNYHEKSAPQYQQLLDNPRFPLARFHFAREKRALGDYAAAESEMTTFLEGYTTDEDDIRREAQREIANIRFVQKQLNRSDLKLYTVNKAPGALTDTGATYAPVWSGANQLLVTSTRPVETDKDNLYTNRIYQVSYDGGNVSDLSKLEIDQPKEIHQGTAAMVPGGKTMYMSRWTVGDGMKEASIYSSTLTDGKWSVPAPVASLNAAGSNSQQPYVTEDGKYILFSSDRPGGSGGFDLYYAPLDEIGMPGAPVNMGAVINTIHDEQAPTMHAASKTLVFSSNGRVGMGGYDFFYSKGGFLTPEEPINFGYPVNSVKDDIYFAARGNARNILENVLLSSDRDASCCLELFVLNKQRVNKALTGSVVDCQTRQPMEGISVNIVDTKTNKTVMTLITDASGKYEFELDDYQPLRASAAKTGYLPGSISFNTPEDPTESYFTTDPICLTLIPEEPITVENVYYDFNKWKLRPESFPALDELVNMLNDDPNMQIELSSHTDSKGSDSYNMKLSQRRAQSVVDYLVKKGIDKTRLKAQGYGESQPVAENENPDGTDNPDGRQKNRRTEFKVLKN